MQSREQVHALHQHPDGQAADDVGDEHDDARNGIALDELHGPVHGAEELRFAGQQCASSARLAGIDVAGAQFGVDGQLLTRHGVQGETRPDLCHTFRAFRNHDELNRRENEKHDNTDDEIARHHEAAEGMNDLAGIGFE